VIDLNLEAGSARDALDWRRYAAIAALSIVAAAALAFVITYVRYARMTDRKLREGPFSGTADIYAANPPRLIMNVSDRNRENRRIVQYREIPKVLIDAVLSAEDKHFFHHHGFDFPRMVKAAWIDLKQGRKDQGASTLKHAAGAQHVLEQDKSWRRKAIEIAIAMRLEERLTKEQILEYYCNQVYLGRRGTFSLHGFGAASAAYFGKDVTGGDAARSRAARGLIQRPSYFHPLGNVDRLRERRNLVLSLMRQNGVITSATTGAPSPRR